jgi:hypothetical protein
VRSDAAVPPVAAASGDVRAGLVWLVEVRAAARAARRSAPRGLFGLFGSSIAATWLAQELDGAVDFFVDEDPNRNGASFMDRPIVAPEDVTAGAHVFIGVGGGMAQSIADRLRRSSLNVSWLPASPI